MGLEFARRTGIDLQHVSLCLTLEAVIQPDPRSDCKALL
jgi:hypothetical protein